MRNHNQFHNFMNPRRSLAEWVLIVTIVGSFVSFFGLIIFTIAVNGCIDQRPGAESQARKWGADMGLNITNVSCANRDTDHDGYVSCTVGTKNDKGEIQLHAIECASKMSWNDGCRAPKLRVSNYNGQ